MESTAQYWRPVWETLERDSLPARSTRDGASPMEDTLHLAQAQSNRGPRGRKRDVLDAERLVKRLVAQELTLSFVPDAEQRLWRAVMRRKYQLTRNRVQVHNRLEALLEEAHIKLSSAWSRTCWGPVPSGCSRRWRRAKPIPLPWRRWPIRDLRATPAQISDALSAATDLNPVYRQLVRMALDELRLIEEQIRELDQEMARLPGPHQGAVERLAEAPSLGVDSAQQIHRGSRADRRDVSLAQAALVLGGGLSRRGGECGCELEPPLPRR